MYFVYGVVIPASAQVAKSRRSQRCQWKEISKKYGHQLHINESNKSFIFSYQEKTKFVVMSHSSTPEYLAKLYMYVEIFTYDHINK